MLINVDRFQKIYFQRIYGNEAKSFIENSIEWEYGQTQKSKKKGMMNNDK